MASGLASYTVYSWNDTGEVIDADNLFTITMNDPSAFKDGRIKKAVDEMRTIESPPYIRTEQPPKFTNTFLLEELAERDIAVLDEEQSLRLPGMKASFLYGPFNEAKHMFGDPEGGAANILKKIGVKKDEEMSIRDASLDIIEQTYPMLAPQASGKEFIKIHFPYPDNTLGTRIPSYTPQFKVVGYDVGVLSRFEEMLAKGSFGDVKRTETAIAFYQKMVDSVKQWAYNSGTLEGLLTRYTQMAAAAEAATKIQTFSKRSVDQIVNSMRKYMPRDTSYILFNLDTYDFKELLSRSILKLPPGAEHGDKVEMIEYSWFIKLNKTSNAGPLWNKVKPDYVPERDKHKFSLKKGDTWLADYQIATNLIRSLGPVTFTFHTPKIDMEKATQKAQKSSQSQAQAKRAKQQQETLKKSETITVTRGLHSTSTTSTTTTTTTTSTEGTTRNTFSPLSKKNVRQAKSVGVELRIAEGRVRELNDIEIMSSFWLLFKWLRLFNWFAKAEAYEILQRLFKTRGIAANGNYAMIPAQIFMTPILETLMNFRNHNKPLIWSEGVTNGGTLCGLKTSIFNGTFMWFHKQVKDLMKMKDGSTLIMVYADNTNLFIKHSDTVYTVSLDLRKAESTVGLKVATALGVYCARSYPKIVDAWERYMTIVFPRLAVRGVALVGNQQLPYNLLGSGTTGTHYFNSVQTTDNIDICIEKFNDDDRGLTNPFVEFVVDEDGEIEPKMSVFLNEAMAETGSVFELEIFDYWNGDFQENPIAFDFLGFDAQCVQVDDDLFITIGVLAEDRLLKTLTLNKDYHDEKGEPTHSISVISFLQFVKLRALMYLGGWTNVALHKFLWEEAKRVKKILDNLQFMSNLNSDRAEELIQQMCKDNLIEPEWLEGIASVFSQSELPTYFSIIKLHTGDPSVALRFVTARIGLVPTTHLISDAEAFSVGYIIEEHAIKTELENPLYAEFELGYNPITLPRKGEVVSDLISHGIKMLRGETPKILTKKDIREDYQLPKEAEYKEIKLTKTPKKDIPLQNYVRPDKPPLEKRVPHKAANPKGFREWVIDNFNTGESEEYHIYRVPVAERFLDKLSKVENESATAVNTLTSILASSFHLHIEDVGTVVKRLSSRILFILRPWPAKTQWTDGMGPSGYGTRKLPYFSGLETSPMALKPGNVRPRSLTNIMLVKPGIGSYFDAEAIFPSEKSQIPIDKGSSITYTGEVQQPKTKKAVELTTTEETKEAIREGKKPVVKVDIITGSKPKAGRPKQVAIKQPQPKKMFKRKEQVQNPRAQNVTSTEYVRDTTFDDVGGNVQLPKDDHG